MTDLRTLHEAFAELERRADAVPSADHLLPSPARRPRGVLVAACIAAIATVLTCVSVVAVQRSHRSTPPAGSTAFRMPHTRQELAARFRRVLGDRAVITSVDSSVVGHPIPVEPGIWVSGPRVGNGGTWLLGTLRSPTGPGGFDLAVRRSASGSVARCAGTPPHNACRAKAYPDGSTLSVSEVRFSGSQQRTYSADFVRADGVEIELRVSNAHDPEGYPDGEEDMLAARPPLTADDLAAIVTSDRW
jgi:hypothetical protein